MYARIIKLNEKEVLHEAEEIIADELDELNRQSRYCFTPSEIAKEFGMSGSDLNSFLRDRKILYRQNGCHHLTSKYRGQGLTAYRYTLNYGSGGRRRMHTKLVWTQRGREFLHELIVKS